MFEILVYIVIGIVSGAIVGLLGLAGGLIIIPGLVYLAGFSQKMAVGTNLFLLMLPISMAAAIENYNHGNVNVRAVICIGIAMLITAFVSTRFMNIINQNYLKIGFGVFIIVMGIYIVVSTIGNIK